MTRTTLGHLAPAWALIGVGALFTSAVTRLGSRGVSTLSEGLSPGQWVVLVLFTSVMVYGEGVLALQRKWVPRLLDRARAVRDESLGLRILAPFYGLSLVGGPVKQLLRGWLSTIAIVTAVVVVRSFSEPWRGIVDFAVASALAWGLISILLGAPGVFRSAEAEPSSESVGGHRDTGREAHPPDEIDRDHDARRVPE
jgi:hypothetical protein